MIRTSRAYRGVSLDLARVLVVDDNPTARLTLQTVLEAGGYRVDAAATAAEAVGKMDREQYELVLSDLQMESPEAGLKVIAHANMMDYKPATAIITTEIQRTRQDSPSGASVLVEPEDVPGLLGKVANLIAQRVGRLLQRQLRNSRN
jgi:Response regulator containing CheY-like receiver, AAA-type ATPase, and DNA-binding domains